MTTRTKLTEEQELALRLHWLVKNLQLDNLDEDFRNAFKYTVLLLQKGDVSDADWKLISDFFDVRTAGLLREGRTFELLISQACTLTALSGHYWLAGDCVRARIATQEALDRCQSLFGFTSAAQQQL